MSVRFAGSRCVDERRRRRIASDGDAHALPTSTDVAARESDAGDVADEAPPAGAESPPAAPNLPSMPFVPAEPWKHGLLAFAIVSVAGTCLLAGRFAVSHAASLGPGFELLFSLEGGRVPRLLSCLLLTAAAQLCVVIWWARSLSTRDFSGRYDVWLWAAGGWFTFALAVGTGAHEAWMRTVEWSWAPRFWNKGALVWLAPTIGAGAVLWSAVVGDMRRCTPSRVLMYLAGLAWLAAGLLELGVAQSPLGPFNAITEATVALAGHAVGCIAMLVHLRYVVHVNNDPPVPRAAVRTRPASEDAPQEDESRAAVSDEAALGRGARVEGRGPESVGPSSLDSPSSSRCDGTAGRGARVEGREPKSDTPSIRDGRTRSGSASAPAEESKPEPAPKPRTGDETRANETPQRVDVPHADRQTDQTAGETSGDAADGPPPEMLRGLSKRQRRKLRKEWKDRQRAGAA